MCVCVNPWKGLIVHVSLHVCVCVGVCAWVCVCELKGESEWYTMCEYIKFRNPLNVSKFSMKVQLYFTFHCWMI